MKTATLPSIRVEPGLRDQLEGVLREDESLSAFVESAVRENLQRRLDQAAFLQRGIRALAAAQRTGQYVSAQTVVRKLEDKLAVAEQMLQQRKPPSVPVSAVPG